MQNELITNETSLNNALKTVENYAVFCYFSTERYLLQSYAKKTINALLKQSDKDVTIIQGPKIDIEEIIAATGVISFFGTKRIVNITEIDIAALTDKDAKELADVIQNVDNSIIIMSCIIKEEKALTTKKAKILQDAVLEIGLLANLKKPTLQSAQVFAISRAKTLGAQLSQGNAAIIVERLLTDYALIENEVAKLAAAVEYKEITRDIINKMSTNNIQANVFDMVRFVTTRRLPQAVNKLKELFDLQNDEIQITGAMCSSFIDIYRVKMGLMQKKDYSIVFKDFAYKGSDYRLKKAKETSAYYTKEQLEIILNILCSLDEKLKSTPADKKVLLLCALFEVANVGAVK